MSLSILENRSRLAVCLLLLCFCACAPRPATRPVMPPSTPAPAREERFVIGYDGQTGKTALELLKAQARVRTRATSLGELVEEINGVASGEGRYLIFFVNGKKSMTGAGNYVTRADDRIEWKLVGPPRT